ncbi:MAG: DUF349 domain-containing protein [Acidobacteriota bacterium]|nr:DUF349 domain-containing protein [Acidobacteriota bacterium]
MSFLDRFKPQPRWKHTDPAVRLEAVPTLPDDDEHLAVLQELARQDADVRVRRAAGDRLTRVEDIVLLARAEADEQLRREYTDRLVGFATAPAPNDAAASLALEGLADEKQFATVAKSSPHDTVRAAALGRIHETKLLSSVARHAEDGQTAADAVARIADPAELLNIATRTEHKDAGVSALERALEANAGGDVRDLLDTLANRAKSKAVSKRARALIQAMDDQETAKRAALEQWQHRVAQVVARAEMIAAAPGTPGASAQLDDAEAEWRSVTGDGAFELDSDTSARFGTLVQQGRTEVERLEREASERREKEERRTAMLATRTQLVERVDQARGEETLEQIDAARAEWTALDEQEPLGSDDVFLQGRFEQACRRAAERHQRRAEIQQMSTQLEELAVQAETAAAQDDTSDDAWRAITKQWEQMRGQVDDLNPAVSERYAAAEARMADRENDRRAATERTLKQQVQRVEQLIERTNKRATAEDLTLREADRIARDLKNAVESPVQLPPREQAALIERVRDAQGVIGPKLHEMRELDEWKRFANAAVQEELIARAEALRAKYPFDKPEELKPDDLDAAARELHEIQERWKLAADAPRAQAQALWHRYRQAADPVQTRVREFFAKRAQERAANLQLKMALIERAEALGESTDWVRTAEEFKKLQAEWQAVGPVPRAETRMTWKRFREASDKFFTRRNADLAQRKEAWAANLSQKEALIARAEELQMSTDWEKTAAEIRKLQADWKTSGPVRRNKSEIVWQRFHTAGDIFFERYKRRDQIELEGKQADREAIVAEVEALAAEPPAETAAILERVRGLRSKWNQSTPVVRQGADPLSARLNDAMARLTAAAPDAFKGTELDVDANRERMEKLIAKVEGLLTESAPPTAGSQALASMLREALASNTIGGRAGEEAKWKAMAEDVRQAQQSWSRLGPVPGDQGRVLADRFHNACSRFFEVYRRKVPPTPGPSGSGPRGGSGGPRGGGSREGGPRGGSRPVGAR